MKKIIFLHHSTGKIVWRGRTNRYINKLTGRSDVARFFRKYNRINGTSFLMEECTFPAKVPYGWKNYPYDYYNIWVKNAGENPYMEEPTLEILTKKYDLIIFKHCYPVSKISADSGKPDIDSDLKSLENYKLQYIALKNKMHEFTANKFILWTPAVMTRHQLSEEQARRTNEFYHWIKDEWKVKGDNIYLWDFYKYETQGGLYLADSYAEGPANSHINRKFATKMASLFSKFIIDVLNGTIE